MGAPFLAIDPAKQASELASLSGMKTLERKSLTALGVMFADTGNISEAIECYARPLEIVQQLSDKDGECVVWINIGVALLYAAQYRDAIDCFERVLAIAGESPTFQASRLSALSNIALASLHLEDYARGLRAAEAALKEIQRATKREGNAISRSIGKQLRTAAARGKQHRPSGRTLRNRQAVCRRVPFCTRRSCRCNCRGTLRGPCRKG